jgi:hypothetical protein
MLSYLGITSSPLGFPVWNAPLLSPAEKKQRQTKQQPAKIRLAGKAGKSRAIKARQSKNNAASTITTQHVQVVIQAHETVIGYDHSLICKKGFYGESVTGLPGLCQKWAQTPVESAGT